MLNISRVGVEVSNKYQVLQELMDEETVDNAWNRVKEAFVSTCREVLGPKKHHHKEWISVETLNKIQERKKKKAAVNVIRTRAEKSKVQEKYIEAYRRVKKSIRQDKRKYIDNLATEAEEAA